MNVNIDGELCIGCARCVIMCPARILKMDNATNTAACTADHRCDRARGCEAVCPVGAIKIS